MSDQFSIHVLGSGSRGNGTILSFDETKILVDSGFSMKEILKRMEMHGIHPSELDAIVLTHYHSDHIHSAHMLSNRFHLPVYCTEETYPRIVKKSKRPLDIHIFNREFEIKQLKLMPIPVDHDAEGTVAFHIKANSKGITIATDLGHVTDELGPFFRESQVWLLESNHDPYLLRVGPYPMDLKYRIASKFGHLSNQQALETILKFAHEDLQTLILGHLSQENNSPSIVMDRVETDAGHILQNKKLFIATQDVPLPPIII